MGRVAVGMVAIVVERSSKRFHLAMYGGGLNAYTEVRTVERGRSRVNV